MKTFDLFGRLPSGKLFWIEAVSDMGAARTHADRLSEIFPGEYFIYSEQDGQIINCIRAPLKLEGPVRE